MILVVLVIDTRREFPTTSSSSDACRLVSARREI